MSKVPSDLDIAQAATLQHISKIAKKLGVSEDDIDMYGKFKAKLPLHLINDEKSRTKQLDIGFGSYANSCR
jgi:formate--tetrahydrofolate ligase